VKEAAMKLGKYLKEKRLAVGLTQFEVASYLGYTSAQFISNMERGCCFPPNKVLRGMIKLYKIPVDELLEFLVEIDTLKWRKALTKRS
jgi:transcriptional regulator with XRE-family HTH domain